MAEDIQFLWSLHAHLFGQRFRPIKGRHFCVQTWMEELKGISVCLHDLGSQNGTLWTALLNCGTFSGTELWA